MKELLTSIDIQAPPEKVWKILTDFSKYGEWNPFITGIEGPVEVGKTFMATMQAPGSKPMVFKPMCVDLNPPHLFSWKGHLLFKSLFKGHHIFELNDLGNGATRLVHKELFSGVLATLLWGQLNTKTRAGFEELNLKLKERAESMQ